MAAQVNLVYLGLWMTVISLGMFQFGYGIGMFNNFTGILFEQYRYNGKNVVSSESTFDSLVTTAVPIGASVGSFMGGLLASIGRKNGLHIANAFICVGAGITMIFNFYSLIIGRIILGFGCGAFTVISPLFISETSPPSVAGAMGAINQFMVTAGIMIAYFMGYLAPIRYLKGKGEAIDPEVFTTDSWRIVFIIPAGIAVIQSALVLLIFRYDTPKYYRQNGNEALEEKVYESIYKSRDSVINHSVLDVTSTREKTVPVSAL